MHSVGIFFKLFVLFCFGKWGICCFWITEPEPAQRSPGRVQVLAEGGRRKGARHFLFAPDPFRRLSMLSCNPHRLLLTCCTPFTHSGLLSYWHTFPWHAQSSKLAFCGSWLCNLWAVKSYTREFRVSSTLHTSTSKTVMFIEKGNIIYSTYQAFSSARITLLLKQNSKLPAEGSLCTTLLVST